MQRRPNVSTRGQVLVLLLILLAILGGGFWYLARSREINEKASNDFAREAAARIALQADERFLDRTLSPEAQLKYPPSWRWRMFEKMRELGTPEQNIEVYGKVEFTSGFFDPTGIFRVKINYAGSPAYLDLNVSHPRALWQIDIINFTWTPHVETPPTQATPEPSAQPTPSPTPERTTKPRKKKRLGS